MRAKTGTGNRAPVLTSLTPSSMVTLPWRCRRTFQQVEAAVEMQEPQTSSAHLMVGEARQRWAPGTESRLMGRPTQEHKAGWIMPTFIFCVNMTNSFDTAL